MARMWPVRLPRWVREDSRRSAEVRVYEKLSSALSDDWHVYYSRPWMGIGPRGGEIEGEADFILAHPDGGLLFLEVKGGRISHDPEEAQWISVDRLSVPHRIKDPVQQASACKHQYIKRLRAAPGWPKHFVRFRHGVVLPDSAAPPPSALSIAAYEKALFCCANDFDSIAGWIEERLNSFAPSSGEAGPGQGGMNTLHQLIAAPVELRVPALREVEGDLLEMNQLLTGAQYILLGMLAERPRVLVEGGAGTGKTVVAVELAARESEEGTRVLFCCRSEPLASNVRKRLKSYPGVTVLHFEALRAFRDAAWQSIIIDEAQDFDPDWWSYVENLAAGVRLRIFTDANQAVYRLRDDLATRLALQDLSLSTNLRNTKAIARITEGLYRGPLIRCAGPQGVPPVTEECPFDSAKARCVEAVSHLLKEEQLRPGMLAILVPDANAREELIGKLSRQHVHAADALRAATGDVIVETVARFKGLEADVVLLAADRTLARNAELSYVAVSRPRSRLYVYGQFNGTVLAEALVRKTEGTA